MGLEMLEESAGRAVMLSVVLSACPLVLLFVVGLCTAVLQAATQIQEHTMSFVPKLFVLGAVLFTLGPWGLEALSAHLTGSLQQLPGAAAPK